MIVRDPNNEHIYHISYTIYYILYTILYTIYYTLYTVYYILYCILYTTHYILPLKLWKLTASENELYFAAGNATCPWCPTSAYII